MPDTKQPSAGAMRAVTDYPKAGEIYYDTYGAIRVMGVIEDYVVARRHKAAPFIEHWKHFVCTKSRKAKGES